MNLYSKTIIITTLFISVFTFAAVEPWAVLLMQFFIFAPLIAYMYANGHIKFTALNKILFLFFIACLLLTVLQCLNEKTILDTPGYYPLTLSRLYSVNEIVFMFTVFAASLACAGVFDNFKSVKTLCLCLTVCGLGVITISNIFVRNEYILLFRKTSTVIGSFGPFVNRNHAGIFLNMCFFASLGYFLQSFIDNKEKNIGKYLLSFAVLAILAFGIISTFSRGSMMALTVTSVLFLFVYSLYFFKTKNAKIITATGLIILSIVLFKAVSINVNAINKFTQRSGGYSEAVRIELYKSAVDMIQEYPTFGVGVGSFPLGIDNYFIKNVDGYIDRLHNDWLEFVLGFGITGGLILFITIILITYNIFNRLNKIDDNKKKIVFLSLSASLFAMCLGSAVDFDFHIPANALTFFIVFGALSSETFGWRISFNKSFFIKTAITVLAVFSIMFYFRYTLAWHNFFMGTSRVYESKADYFERGFYYYPSAPYAERLAIAYYNAFVSEHDELKKTEYSDKLDNLTSKYLKRYPANKNLREFKYISDNIKTTMR